MKKVWSLEKNENKFLKINNILIRQIKKKVSLKVFWMIILLEFHSPANRYMTPVTNTALIWCLKTPNNPTRAEEPRIMRHTRAQDIDKFCIPETNTRVHWKHFIKSTSEFNIEISSQTIYMFCYNIWPLAFHIWRLLRNTHQQQK